MCVLATYVSYDIRSLGLKINACHSVSVEEVRSWGGRAQVKQHTRPKSVSDILQLGSRHPQTHGIDKCEL